ncbi:MAG: hypothetical protein JWO36_1246 [Myxococcales bacterium]|nr:hypothetical protein [Myxococcales bacterium]
MTRIAVAAAALLAIGIALYVLVRRGSEPAATTTAVIVHAAPPDARMAMPAVTADATRDAVEPPTAAATAAREERTTVLASVRDSGEAHESWEAQGTSLLRAFEGQGTVSDVGCYVAGCGATLTFRSQAAYQRALDDITASAAYREWTGGKRLTSPEIAADGSVSVALVLYRPD